MDYAPLSQHRHRFPLGQPTPLGIYDASGRLLLARGHRLDSLEQLEKLIDREAQVDLRESAPLTERISRARPEQLPVFWDQQLDEMGRLLRSQPQADFAQSLDRTAEPLLALIDRDPDLAILQTVRAEALVGGPNHYAARHAVHAATAACLAARRIGWGVSEVRCVMRTALTMNLSLTELQNKLVIQASPLTPLQRAEIQAHPERSALMLEMSGVKDADWLAAVRQHHEEPGGKGYPMGLTEVGEIAQLVHCADTFTAKLAPRQRRPALLADVAVRLQFQASRGCPFTAAMIKEFGLYPPGCAVRLKSGEVGMVMRRGETTNTPRVAVVTDRAGNIRIEPAARDTARPEFGVAAVIPMSGIKVRVGLEQLIQSMHH